jgi:hypothetical protein
MWHKHSLCVVMTLYQLDGCCRWFWDSSTHSKIISSSHHRSHWCKLLPWKCVIYILVWPQNIMFGFQEMARHFHRWSYPMHKKLCVHIGEVSCSTRRELYAGISSCALYVRNWIAISWSCRNVNTIWQFVLTEVDHTSFPLQKSLCNNQVIASASTGPY